MPDVGNGYLGVALALGLPVLTMAYSPALLAGGDALQLWAFWLAPLVGAAVAGISHAVLLGADEEAAPPTEATQA